MNPLLTSERWRKFLTATCPDVPDWIVEHMRRLASEAYARDPGGWTEVDVPGDFGLHGWGAESGIQQDDFKRLVEECGSQAKAAEVAGVSQATVSRAVRRYSPIWDDQFWSAGYSAVLICAYERMPCHFTEMERAIAELIASTPNVEDMQLDWRRYLRGAIALGFIARGSDGRYHIGSGVGCVDARDQARFIPGRMAGLCPKDPKHGPTREKYCPKCKARIGGRS